MITRAVVLAAGFGTRLRPLTNERPKPLIPVGDRPLLQHIFENLARASIREVSVNAHHLSQQVIEFTKQQSWVNMRITCAAERQLLGTAGGVRALVRGTSEPVLVWNGDIFAPELALESLFPRSAPRAPMLVVAPTPSSGSVGLDAAGRVVRVRGEGFGRETRAADYTGIALLPPEFIECLPTAGCLVGDALLPWLRSGRPVHSVTFTGFWSDGGTLNDYLLQNRYWLQAQQLTAFKGARAEVTSGVSLSETVVGAGAVISGAGELSRCVVWPGARAVAPLDETVILTDGTRVTLGAPVDHDS